MASDWFVFCVHFHRTHAPITQKHKILKKTKKIKQVEFDIEVGMMIAEGDALEVISEVFFCDRGQKHDFNFFFFSLPCTRWRCCLCL
jgi:hypothetical protein